MERAAHDLKSVITTYEGKHNHNIPAARNGNSMAPNKGPAQVASAAAGSDSVLAHLHRPKPSQPHNDMARFDRSTGPSSLGPPVRQQLGLGHRNGFSFGMNQPRLSNLAMAGFGLGQGKPHVMPYLGQLLLGRETGFLLPKEEPNVPSFRTSHGFFPRGIISLSSNYE